MILWAIAPTRLRRRAGSDQRPQTGGSGILDQIDDERIVGRGLLILPRFESRM
jgi:hypothetical protein